MAGFPYNVAESVKWAQWSYLFDNTYLIDSTRFNNWFKEILESGEYEFNESFTRLWAESFNLLFNKVDLSEWSEKEFIKALFCTLAIIENIVAEDMKIESREVRKSIRTLLTKILKERKKEFILMPMGAISEDEYVRLIGDQIISNYSRKD